jgi:Phage ABA sandwich domain
MSRELDTWIAINIIGFDGMAIDEDGDYYVMDRSKEEIYSHVLPYSSDMNEAVKVLRELQVNDESCALHLWYDFAWFLERDGFDNNKYQLAHSDTPAMAICLAAYKLKTGKDWE